MSIVGTYLFVFPRWAKLRINMLPATIICEPISECFVASLVIGWAAHHVFRWDIMVFFMCHCLAWFIFDYIQLRGVQVCSLFFFFPKVMKVFSANYFSKKINVVVGTKYFSWHCQGNTRSNTATPTHLPASVIEAWKEGVSVLLRNLVF